MKTLLFTLAVMAGMAHPGTATAVGRLVDLGVYDRTSQRALPVYRHDGRYYIAGEPGHRYQLTLRSRSGAELMTMLSVDGVNVISGETADWSQTGYVLDPYEGINVLGWRKSLAQVADFVFADFAHSYAVRTGRPENVGVIGVAVFCRQDVYPPPMPMSRPIAEAVDAASRETLDTSAPAPAAEAGTGRSMASPGRAPAAAWAEVSKARADTPLGTGHGQREDSPISYVDFERASSTPDEVITLYYDTRAHLLARGVLPAPVPRTPQPFPDQFVPDP
jgi:hypothetical protein